MHFDLGDGVEFQDGIEAGDSSHSGRNICRYSGGSDNFSGSNTTSGGSNAGGVNKSSKCSKTASVASLFRLRRAVSYNETELRRAKKTGEAEGLLEGMKHKEDFASTSCVVADT